MGPMMLGDLVGQELFWKQRKVGRLTEKFDSFRLKGHVWLG